MTDYRYIYSSKLKRRSRVKSIALGGAFVVLLGLVGTYEQTPEPVVQAVASSNTEDQIAKILPPPLAKAIVERAEYPRTMAAIAHTESRGNHTAVGDHGKSRGAFQVQPRFWGDVPDSIEEQVDQANRIFMLLVKQYGYREAVRRYNGSGSASIKYQQTVLAKVGGLQ